MATAQCFRFKTENYLEQMRTHWPSTGKHILAQYDDDHIIVYQAFCPEIADYAVQYGKFGGPKYSFTRMTWIKTNFLWMMYRCNWAQKKNQDRILAIYITRDGFDQILKFSKGKQSGIRVASHMPGNVRIQWDPDHDPKGENQRRRAVQLGIKGIPLQRFHEQYIQHIEDITEFVKEQRKHVLKNEIDKLLTPSERVYTPAEKEICQHILLDEYHEHRKEHREKIYVRENVNPRECNSSEGVIAQHENRSAQHENKSIEDISRNIKGGYASDTSNTFEELSQSGAHKQDLIVCLGGSFNPVHAKHIKLIETAIDWLEHSGYNVVAARLAVAPDSSVQRKCKRKNERCLKSEHRIKLCELMCEGRKLVKPYYTPISSAFNCGENVRKWENFTNAKVAVVIGCHKVMSKDGRWKWNSKSKCITVCVTNKEKSEAITKAYFDEFNEDLTFKPDFYIVEGELPDISSTEIRKCLNTTLNVDKAITQGLHPEVVINVVGTKSHDDLANDTSYDRKDDRAVPLYWDEADEEGEQGKSVQPNTEENEQLNCDKVENDLSETTTTKFINSLSKDIKLRQIVNDLSAKGWVTDNAAQFILDNFSDLYL